MAASSNEQDDAAIEAVVEAYCAAWDEPDRRRRAALLRQAFDEEGVYTDPTVHLVGIPALMAHIDKVMAAYPGSTILRTSRVDRHHAVLRFGWRKRLANGDLLAESVDFCALSSDGKLSLVVGFFGPLVRLEA